MTLRTLIQSQEHDELTIKYRLALSPLSNHISRVQRQPYKDILPSVLDLRVVDYDPDTRVYTLTKLKT